MQFQSVDITGRKFGKLVAVELSYRSAHRESFWKCRCSCGAEVAVRLDHLNSGERISCTFACRQTLEERVWPYVAKGPGCWEWTGLRNTYGYGTVRVPWIRKSPIHAHRMIYEMMVGKIPDGMFLCHKCDNPGCVNPDHMFVGTVLDNTRDMIAKGRDRNIHQKLTREERAEAVSMVARGVPKREVARRFGVSPTNIRYLYNRAV